MITDFVDLEPPDVREIRVDRVTLAYRSPMATAHGTISQRDVVVLTLVDGEGRFGRGEAAPMTAFTPETADGAERALRRWADDGAEPTGSPTARAAIDGALLDLAAQAARHGPEEAQLLTRPRGRPVTCGQYRNRRGIRLRAFCTA